LTAGQLDGWTTAKQLDGSMARRLDGWMTAKQLDGLSSLTDWRLDGWTTALLLLIQIFLLLSLSL
jgi:hypothetical protein